MNKSLPILAQYLEAAGVNDQTSPEEIKEHRKRFKTLYHRLYSRQRRAEKLTSGDFWIRKLLINLSINIVRNRFFK